MCGKSIDYDQSEMRKHFRTRHEGWSLENYYDNFIRKKQVINPCPDIMAAYYSQHSTYKYGPSQFETVLQLVVKQEPRGSSSEDETSTCDDSGIDGTLGAPGGQFNRHLTCLRFCPRSCPKSYFKF